MLWLARSLYSLDVIILTPQERSHLKTYYRMFCFAFFVNERSVQEDIVPGGTLCGVLRASWLLEKGEQVS